MRNKPKRGLPTLFRPAIPSCVRNYINECLKSNVFPTIGGLANYLKVGTQAIYDWKVDHEDFSRTIEELMDIQKQLLITNGLTGTYGTRFVIFLLNANMT